MKIEAVYGSPDANKATGELMSVNTLFPSPLDEEGRTKVKQLSLSLLVLSYCFSSHTILISYYCHRYYRYLGRNYSPQVMQR